MTVRRLGALIAVALLACCGGDTEPDGDSSVSLLALDADDEAGDTAVREAIFVAVNCAVVEEREVPATYGMFTPAGDRRVLEAVESFVAEVRAKFAGLPPEARIDRLWGDAWGVDVRADASDCDAYEPATRNG